MTWSIVGATLLGAALGFAYQRLVGCRSGVCLITSKWYVATSYGAVMGYMLAHNAH